MGHYGDNYDSAAQAEVDRIAAVTANLIASAHSVLNGLKRLPASRERSIAATHIETAVRWLR